MSKARELDQLFQQLLVEAQDKQLVQQGQGFRVDWRGNW
jgi:hypothetical protein